jgi:hypothetical protein
MHKQINKSKKYKFVAEYIGERGKSIWKTDPKSSTFYETEREAAVAVDKRLIYKGKEPINVLVKKK